jgi:hypothetical protein
MGGFVSRHPIGGVGLAWIPGMILAPFTPWSSALGHSAWGSVINILFGMVTAAAYFYAVGRYEEALIRRVEDTEPKRWNVAVNAVDVGTMSDSDYAAIQLDVIFSARIFVRQCQALLSAAVIGFFRFTKDLPFALFWLVVMCALADPATISSWADALRHTAWSATDIHNGAFLVIKIVAIFYVLTALVMGIANVVVHGDIQRAVNVQNIYSERIRVALRQHMKCAADGTVTLELRQQGGRDVTRSFRTDYASGAIASSGESIGATTVGAYKPES